MPEKLVSLIPTTIIISVSTFILTVGAIVFTIAIGYLCTSPSPSQLALTTPSVPTDISVVTATLLPPTDTPAPLTETPMSSTSIPTSTATTVSPTNTPTLTATPLPPTNTPTPTATAVPPTHTPTPTLEAKPKPGYQAPDFTLSDLSGKQVNLSDFRGKVVVLNMWTSWCGPCREEMPNLQSFHQDYADRDVAVVAVNLREESGTVTNFVEEYGLTFVVLLDTSGEVGDMYGTKPIPTTFLIDKAGIIREKIVGSMEKQELIDKTSNLLNE